MILKSLRRAGLGLALAAFVAAPALAAGPHDGDWAGELKAGDQTLHLIFHFKTVGTDASAELESIEQQATIPSTAVKFDGDKVSVLYLAVGGELEGQFSADNKSFTGTWKQGLALPLTLTKK